MGQPQNMELRTTESTTLPEPIIKENKSQLDDYISRLQTSIADLSDDAKTLLMARAMAEIELDVEMEPSSDKAEVIATVLKRLGEPGEFGERLRTLVLPDDKTQIQAMVGNATQAEPRTGLTPCRTCGWLVSWDARSCPHCGAPNPVIAAYIKRAYGYEWKSKATVFGYPLVHIAFGRAKNGKVRVAKGVIAIGQFGIGAITIAQVGVGYVAGIGQAVIAPLALGQLAIGMAAIGQIAIGALLGVGVIASGATAIGAIGKVVLHLTAHFIH
jgi:hypothetical protein